MLEQAADRLQNHDQGHNRQGHRTREPAQNANFARTKRVLGIVGMAACILIGKNRNAKGRNVCGHVPTIGQKRHGTEGQARDDFANHGDRRKNHDRFRIFLGILTIARKVMGMLPGFQRMNMHRKSFRSCQESLRLNLVSGAGGGRSAWPGRQTAHWLKIARPKTWPSRDQAQPF